MWLELATWYDRLTTSRGACSEAEYAGRFIEDNVELLGVLFVDDSVKGAGTTGGTPWGTATTLVYYVYAAAYPMCAPDPGVMIAAPPPPPAEAPVGPPLNDSEITRCWEAWKLKV